MLMVDADPERSALTWSELAEWPFPTISMPTSRIHRELPGRVAMGERSATDVPARRLGLALAQLGALFALPFAALFPNPAGCSSAACTPSR